MSFSVCDKCSDKELSAFHSCFYLALCCPKEDNSSPDPKSISCMQTICDTCTTWISHCEHSYCEKILRHYLLFKQYTYLLRRTFARIQATISGLIFLFSSLSRKFVKLWSVCLYFPFHVSLF